MSILVEVVDGGSGHAAEGVWVSLLREVDSGWQHRGGEPTDAAGAVPTLEPASERGRYRLVIDLDRFYSPLGTEPSVSQVAVTFRVFRSGEQVRLLVVITPTSCVAIRRTGQ